MRIRSSIISIFVFLLSWVNSNAQIDYDLRLQNCIVNDTLYVSVIVDNNGSDFAFATSNFAFDIYQGGVIGDTTGLLFSDKFITSEGPWGIVNAPDYQNMTLGSLPPPANFPHFRLSINQDNPAGTGYILPSGDTDTIGVIGIPLIDPWCGDTISFVWRDENATTWPGHPLQRGDIIQWLDPIYPSIYDNANFINPQPFIMCEGCGGALASSDSLLQGDTTICVGENLNFTVSPPTSDTVTFFVNGVQVQQGLANTYNHTFLIAGVTDEVYAVIGDPSCLACARISDTTFVNVGTAYQPPILASPFGCDSIQLQVEDVGTKYEWYQNGNLMGITNSPITTFNFNVAINDSLAVEIVGMSGLGLCPDSIVVDTVITTLPPASGVNVDLGLDTAVLCFNESLVLNSGFVHDGVNVNVQWQSPLGTTIGVGSTFNLDFVSPPPPNSRELFAVVDSNGCVGIDSVTGIHNYVNALITPNDSTYCDVDTLILRAGPHPASATTTWLFNGGGATVSDSLLVSSIGNGGNGPGNYSLIVENTVLGTSCADTTSRNIVEQVCTINANFTLLDDTFCIYSTNDIIFENTSLGDTAWLWNFGYGAVPSTSTDSLPTGITYTTGGTKTIQLVIFGSGGQTDTIQRTIFIEGEMTPPVITNILNSSDSMVFQFTPPIGADGYEVSWDTNGVGPGISGPYTSGNIDSVTHFIRVTSLSTACIYVRYFNGCYADTIQLCEQAFASNCPITFTPISPVDQCINGDSVCFELRNITLPNPPFNGIIDTANYAINWNGNILNNNKEFCYKPTSSGNQTVDFIIYATDPTANCYVEGQLNVLIKDSLPDLSLQVEPTFVSSTQVSFGWNSVPGATGYIYDYMAFNNGLFQQYDSVFISDTFATFTLVGGDFRVGDSVQILVSAYNECDTINDPDDTTVTVVAIDTCFIGKIKRPSFIADACAFDCYDLEVEVTYPPLSDYTIEWTSPGIIAQGPDKDNEITYCPPNDNSTDLVIFEIVDTAYQSQFGTPCSIQDTFVVDVAPKDIPTWDLKTEFCITSFPYQIDADASPESGWFYMVGDTSNTAVYQAADNKWYFDPGVAGVGTHTLVFKVCGDSLTRTVNVGDIPCVTTIFNEVGARPDGIWTTCDGTIYYSDAGKHSIWSIDTLGTRTRILGDTTQAFRDFLATCPPPSSLDRFRDGHRSFAKTIAPRGLVVIEGTKDIYFADSYNHKIRKYIAATQEIITVAGPKTSAVSADIPAANSATAIADSLARFEYPWGMTMDCEQNYIYFTDVKNQKMRRLQIPEGNTFTAPFFVENVVGNAGLDINATTTGLNGRIGLPFDAPDVCGERVPVFGSHLTMDGDNIYIPDPARSMMYRYNVTTNMVEPFVTPQFIPAYADGTLSFVGAGRTRSPVGSAIIPGADSVFFSDYQNFAIRSAKRIDDVSSELLTISGSPPPANIAGDDDGPLFTARYGTPTAMRFSSSDGYLYICDAFNTPSVGSIRRLALTPELTDPFFGMDTVFCLNDPRDTLVSVYKGGTFQVIQGDTSVLSQLGMTDTFFFNPIVADTFIIEYTATIGCCPRTWTKEFIVNGLPPVLLDSIVFSCDPSSTEIIPDSLNGGWVYEWYDSTAYFSGGAPISTNDSLLGSEVPGGIGEGTYYLSIFDTLTLCTNLDSVEVQVGFSDTLRISGTNTMCFGDSVLLSIDTTAFQNWWWNTGDSTHEIYAKASGDYIAFASVGACITTDTFNVIQNPLPNICINAAIDTTLGRWTVGTLAGDTNLGGGAYLDAQAYNARFNFPWDVLYVDGNLYVTEVGNHVIRRIDLTDTSVTTFAGTNASGLAFTSGVPKLSAEFNQPTGIVYNRRTNEFYMADQGTHRVVRITQDSVFNIVGRGTPDASQVIDGYRDTTTLFEPKDMDIDFAGMVYVSDYRYHSIRKINPYTGEISTLTGDLFSNSPINGTFDNANFNLPWGMDINVEGDLIVPTESHNIRKVNVFDETVETVSGPAAFFNGSSVPGYENGDASTSRYRQPWNVYVCPQNNSYITDGTNHVIRVMDSQGNSKTIAGNQPPSWPSGYMDGDQDIARMNLPVGITAGNGVMYFADAGNNLIRTITKNRDLTICDGQADTLDASCSLQGNETDFYWINVEGDTVRNATILADTSGVFYFHVVDVNGCSNFDSVIVNSISSLIPNINNMTAGRLDSVFGCQGDTIILDADTIGATSYNWTGTSPFVGLVSDSAISTDTSGRYIVEIVNAAGCSSFDTVDVVITPLPQVTFPDSNLCFGETYTVDMSAAGFDSVIWNGIVDTNVLVIDSTNQYIYEGYLNGCIATDTINVFIADSLVINLGNDTTICASDSVLFAPDSFIYSTYQWTLNGNPFSTDSAIITDSAGTYILSVVDSNGCTTTDTVILTVIPAPIFSLPDTNLCFGETFTFDLTSLVADSIIWNNGIDTNLVVADSSGTYYATAYAGSCSFSDTSIVYIADSIYVDINMGDDTVYSCLGDSAVLMATPYGFGSYSWSPGGETDSIISVATGGTYTVIVTDSLNPNCTAQDQVFVEFINSIDLNLDTMYVCDGDSLTLSPSLGNLPSVAGGFIAWSTGDTIFNDADSIVISSTGTYYAEAVLGTCTDYDSLYVSILTPIILTPNIPSINCGDDSLAIGGTPTASGGSGQGYIYQWTSFSDSAHFDDSTAANPIIIFDTTGTYTFNLTVYDSANPSCFTDTTFTFFTGLLPDEVADLGPDTLIVCNDDTVCYDFSQYNFQSVIWFFRDGANNFLGAGFSQDDSICATSSGLVVTEGNLPLVDNYLNIELNTVIPVGGSCPAFSDIDEITIYFADSIVVDPGTDTAICPGEPITLGGNPTASGGSEGYAPNPFTYTWTVNTGATPGSVANPVMSPTDSSYYTLTVVDTVANCSNIASVNVDVYIVPTVSAGNDVTICAGDTTTLNGVITPFDASLTIEWSPNNSTLFDSTVAVTDAFPLDTTVYTLRVYDTIGCSSLADSLVVNVNANPLAGFVFDTVCADSSTTLISSSIGTLTWSANGQTFNGSQISIPFGAGGTYTVELIADNGGCADTIVQQVLVDSIPNVFAGNDTTLCITNDSITLSNAFGGGTVTWSTSNVGGTFSNLGIINPIYTTDSSASTDSLGLLVVDGNGCRNSDQMIITFVPSPAVNAGVYTAGCSGTGITLSQATGVGAFNWTSSGDGTFDSTGLLNATYQFGQTDLDNGGVTLTLTATSTPCPAVSDTASLGINPSAEAIITATVSAGGVVEDTLVEIFVDEGVTFDFLQSINYTLDSTGWDLDGNGTVDDNNSSYFQIFGEAGSSYLYLYASNEFGCFDWDTIRIDVIGNQVVFIPNVFSPNDVNPDNNVLKVFGTNILDNDVFDFKIYNRWGELIFAEPSYSIMNTQGWNGINQFTGEEMPLGVYTYTVKGEFRDGQTFEKVGNVTLIR